MFWKSVFAAIKDGNLQSTRELLEGKEDVDKIRNDDKRTPLHQACLHGRLKIAKYLIKEKKANVNSIDSNGETALYCSLHPHSVEKRAGIIIKIAEFLLTNGADVNAKVSSPGDDTALHRACLGNSTDLIQVLLNHGANVNSRDSVGRTPLYDVCVTRSIDVIKLLLASNADRHIKTNEGRGPAEHLRRHGLHDVFESYDKYPLAVSGGVENIQRARYTQDAVMLNPRLSQHQHAIGTKTLMLVRKLPVHEVAYAILGFLTPAAVEKIFLPAA